MNIKCVIVGDGAVGKTSLVISYTTNTFSKSYVPTVFDNYTTDVMIQGKLVHLGIWDTAGQSNYDRLRPLSYRDTDVFLMCYSVILPSSYDNVKDKWVLEVSHYAPDVPIIVVGTQIDLRDDPKVLDNLRSQGGKTVKTKEDGTRLMLAVKAKSYVECSALTQEGVKEVFDQACLASLEKNVGVQNGCCVVL